MKVPSSFLVINSCNNFLSQNESYSEMFYQHLLYLKKCILLFTPSPLVYGLYACENVDNCELTLSFLVGINIGFNLFENKGATGRFQA